jgi:hypothetical protein
MQSILNNKDDKTAGIKFKYCPARLANGSAIPGSVYDANDTLLFAPDFTFSEKSEGCGYRLRDCTFVNLYCVDNIWYMGAKNAWDISKLHDITDTTYLEYFMEAANVSVPGFNFDMLDKAKMHTVAFSNPRCHLLENRCEVWTYHCAKNEGSIFPYAEPGDADTMDEYMTVSENGEIYIKQSEIRGFVCDKLYFNRKRFYSKDEKLAFYKMLINVYCVGRKAGAHEYMRKYMNRTSRHIWDRIHNIVKDFNTHNAVATTFNGVPVPKRLQNTSHSSNLMLDNVDNKKFLFALCALSPVP